MPARPRFVGRAAPVVLGGLVVLASASCGVLPWADDEAAEPTRFAVIGDVPYGADQLAAFPGWVDRINAAPGVGLAIHVGDLGDGEAACTDEHVAAVREQLDRFEVPLLYTPGDNEWADCHRPEAGAHQPLERLAALRSVFFADPGRTRGARPITVTSQAAVGLPENQATTLADVELATLHVVGSRNDRAPWTGLGLTEPTTAQLEEEATRMTYSVEHLRGTFDRARSTEARAVAVFLQAEMFDASYEPTWDLSPFAPLVRALAEEARQYDGEVYLFNGDAHVYAVDEPLAAGSPWLEAYAVAEPAPDLTRVTVDGASQATGFLEVTVSPPGTAPVLTWERVPYDS